MLLWGWRGGGEDGDSAVSPACPPWAPCCSRWAQRKSTEGTARDMRFGKLRSGQLVPAGLSQFPGSLKVCLEPVHVPARAGTALLREADCGFGERGSGGRPCGGHWPAPLPASLGASAGASSRDEQDLGSELAQGSSLAGRLSPWGGSLAAGRAAAWAGLHSRPCTNADCSSDWRRPLP